MEGLRAFQLYLLSKMRARRAIEKALQELDAGVTEMVQAEQAMVALGVETPGHPAQLYRELLGQPISSAKDMQIEESSPFANSLSLRFKLPLWPSFDFTVHEHPTGYAWGISFIRGHGIPSPNLLSAIDLKPWGFEITEIYRSFGVPELIDGWNRQEDLVYKIQENPFGHMKRYVLYFDYGLLQHFEPLEDIGTFHI